MELFKIYNEDCVETMSKMEDNFIDLIVTSPPYEQLRIYKGFKFDFEKCATSIFRIIKPGGTLVWVVSDQTKNGSESGNSFKQALFFISLGFNLHDTMIYKKNSAPLNHNRYEQEFEFMFVFTKGKPKTFNPILIPCNWFGKDTDRTGQKIGKHGEKGKRLRSEAQRTNIKSKKIKGNIWHYETGFSHSTLDKIAFLHSAIFPEKLSADHIFSWSNEGDII